MPLHRVLVLGVLLVAASVSSVCRGEDASLGSAEFRVSAERPVGWRGDGSGRFTGATPVREWSATKNALWSAAVGKGYSTPVVTERFVLVMSEPSRLTCLDRADGKVLWKVETKPADLSDAKSRVAADEYEPPKDGSGMAAATPVFDGKLIYIVLANGIIRAVDLEGKTRWINWIDAPQSTGYGRSASPILVGGKLIVHMTNLYAFDPASGKQLWVNSSAKSTYGTPAGMKVGDVEVIVTPAGDIVSASDGKGLASEIANATHATPVIGDGTIHFVDPSISAMKLDAAFKEREIWSGTVMGDVFGSPVLHEKMLFVVSGGGTLYVFDAAGKGAIEPLLERKELFENGGGAGPLVYASVALAGKHIFVSSNRGETVVMEATREAKVVGRNKLAGGSGASLVFWGKEMFLRDGDRVTCIGR